MTLNELVILREVNIIDNSQFARYFDEAEDKAVDLVSFCLKRGYIDLNRAQAVIEFVPKEVKNLGE